MENWKALAEKLLFDFGKAVLGKDSGGVIVKLLRTHGISGARDMIASAASKQSPREYVGAMLNGHGNHSPTNIAIGEKIGGYTWDGGKWKKVELVE